MICCRELNESVVSPQTPLSFPSHPETHTLILEMVCVMGRAHVL